MNSLFKIHEHLGRRYFKNRPGDVVLGEGYKKHELATHGKRGLFITEEKRNHIRAVMHRVDAIAEQRKGEPDPQSIDGLFTVLKYKGRQRIINNEKNSK